MEPIARFLMKIDRSQSECWEWTAGKQPNGYGTFYDGKRKTLAHRFSYELHNGPITDGMFVCHSCDNRGCVNPNHLWLGTAKDNLQDMKAKGRRRQPTCAAGHPFAGKNLRIAPSGRRVCRACVAIHSRAYLERKKRNK